MAGTAKARVAAATISVFNFFMGFLRGCGTSADRV
jgi:hypothetical protein